jgi:hypothetical protein
MATKAHREAPGAAGGAGGNAGGSAGQNAAEGTDRLYAAPLEGFVALRREIAVALRAAGDVAGSRAVAALAKPSRTAWALNQVARQHPEVLRAAFEARVAAEAAQKKSADGDALRASARAFRDRLADVVHAAEGVARESGAELTVAQGRRISATVQAIAASDDKATRESLEAGRLGADVDVDDPFAGLEIGAKREPRLAAAPRDAVRGEVPARPARAPADRVRHHEHGAHAHAAHAHAAQERAAQERERARQHEARELEKARERAARELEKARGLVVDLEAEAREARAAAREAEVTAGKAKAEAERARRAVEAIEKRLDEARGAVRALGK